MEILTAVREACFAVDAPVRSRDALLRTIAAVACKCPAAAAIGEQQIYRRLIEREAQGSTGYGHGVAVPHARMDGLTAFVIGIVRSHQAIDFEAYDRKKCRLFVFVLSPQEASTDYLKVLASVSRLLRSYRTRTELLQAPSATALYESTVRCLAPDLAENEKPATSQKLLILVLYLDELLQDILQFFVEQGIDGATIIESSGMGAHISSVPLFAEFISFMHQSKNHSQTIMALIPEARERQIVDGIEAITGDLDKTQGAMLMIQDVRLLKGSMRMM